MPNTSINRSIRSLYIAVCRDRIRDAVEMTMDAVGLLFNFTVGLAKLFGRNVSLRLKDMFSVLLLDKAFQWIQNAFADKASDNRVQ